MKESMQLQYNSAAATGKWPSQNDCPDFENVTKGFMSKCNKVSYDVMRLFAMSLGMEDTEWFTKANDIKKADSMSTLRCIHYPDTYGVAAPPGHWRAGYPEPPPNHL
jgi:isopenicillin N synthase-like dioxygenase